MKYNILPGEGDCIRSAPGKNIYFSDDDIQKYNKYMQQANFIGFILLDIELIVEFVHSKHWEPKTLFQFSKFLHFMND